MKWPCVMAVTSIPVASFLSWGEFDDPLPVQTNRPKVTGPVEMVLSDYAGETPSLA